MTAKIVIGAILWLTASLVTATVAGRWLRRIPPEHLTSEQRYKWLALHDHRSDDQEG